MIKRTLLFSFLIFLTYSCKKKEHSHKTNKKVIHISSNQGEKWNVFGVKIIGKMLSDDTNGVYSVIITETPPGGGPPLHVHTKEDELFYILKGKYLFNYGDKTIDAKQGDYIRLPRGIPHKFTNKDTITGITMNTITPGGFENFFNEVANIPKNDTLFRSKVNTIADKYGIKFIKE